MFKTIAFYKCLKTFNIKPKHFNPVFARNISSSDNKTTDESISQQILSEKMSNSDESDVNTDNNLSFAKAFEKFERLTKESQTEGKGSYSVVSEPFPTLLRYSLFIQLGDAVGKVVVGKIEDVVEDDLYIDFGHKFNAVCKVPKLNQTDYIRGAKVRLRINDLELSDRFLGSSKDMTLLESEATLLGLIWSPTRASERKTDIDIDAI